MTKHHVFPKRFFGGRGPIQELCRPCHDDIERMIPTYTKLTKEEYLQIVEDFLQIKGGDI